VINGRSMIRQLGPPTFFVTFTTGVNNWPELVQMLEDLYVGHNYNNVQISKDVERPKIYELVQMDPVTCARYYDKQMCWFRKLLTPKVLGVFFIKTASKQPLFKAR
jgi:hypothetical protein